MVWHPDIVKPLTALIEEKKITIDLLKGFIDEIRATGRKSSDIVDLLRRAVKLDIFAHNPEDSLLMQAMQKDDTNLVKILCETYIDNVTDLKRALGYTSLYRPVSLLKIAKAASLLNNEELELDLSNKMSDIILATGDTRLHTAARKGNYIKLQEYMKQGDDPNAINIIGDTALHIAVMIPAIQTTTSSVPEQAAAELTLTGLAINNAERKVQPFLSFRDPEEKVNEINIYKKAKLIELLASNCNTDVTIKNHEGYSAISMMTEMDFKPFLTGLGERIERGSSVAERSQINEKLMEQLSTLQEKGICPVGDDNRQAIEWRLSKIAEIMEYLENKYWGQDQLITSPLQETASSEELAGKNTLAPDFDSNTADYIIPVIGVDVIPNI